MEATPVVGSVIGPVLVRPRVPSALGLPSTDERRQANLCLCEQTPTSRRPRPRLTCPSFLASEPRDDPAQNARSTAVWASRVRQETVRLAYDDERASIRLWVALDDDERVHCLLRDGRGGSAGWWPMRSIVEQGAVATYDKTSGTGRAAVWLVFGIVRDDVRAVRVNGVSARISGNVYAVELSEEPTEVVVISRDAQWGIDFPEP